MSTIHAPNGGFSQFNPSINSTGSRPSQRLHYSMQANPVNLSSEIASILDQLEKDPKYIRQLLKNDDTLLGSEIEQTLLYLGKQQAELKLQLAYTEHRINDLSRTGELTEECKQSLYVIQVGLYQKIVENYKQLTFGCEELNAKTQGRFYAKQSNIFAQLGEKLLTQELTRHIPQACQVEIEYEQQRLLKDLMATEQKLQELSLEGAQKSQTYVTEINRRQKKVVRFFTRIIQLYRQKIKFYNHLMSEALLSDQFPQTAPQDGENMQQWREQALARLQQQQLTYEKYQQQKVLEEQKLRMHMQLYKIVDDIALLDNQCEKLADVFNKPRKSHATMVAMTQLQDLLCQDNLTMHQQLRIDLLGVLQSLQTEFAKLEQLQSNNSL